MTSDFNHGGDHMVINLAERREVMKKMDALRHWMRSCTEVRLDSYESHGEAGPARHHFITLRFDSPVSSEGGTAGWVDLFSEEKIRIGLNTDADNTLDGRLIFASSDNEATKFILTIVETEKRDEILAITSKERHSFINMILVVAGKIVDKLPFAK